MNLMDLGLHYSPSLDPASTAPCFRAKLQLSDLHWQVRSCQVRLHRTLVPVNSLYSVVGPFCCYVLNFVSVFLDSILI